jgi:hypothetical protein
VPGLKIEISATVLDVQEREIKNLEKEKKEESVADIPSGGLKTSQAWKKSPNFLSNSAPSGGDGETSQEEKRTGICLF